MPNSPFKPHPERMPGMFNSIYYIILLCAVLYVSLLWHCIAEVQVTPTLDPYLAERTKNIPMKKAKWHLGMSKSSAAVFGQSSQL